MRVLIRLMGVALLVVGLAMTYVMANDIWLRNGSVQAEQELLDLRQDWSRSGPSNHDRGPKEYDRPLRYQEAFAVMRIPRLGAEWEQPVVKGVKDPALALGVGWFPHSVLPGEVGNFSVAGHRCCAATHGEPFAYLDRVQNGDKVFVETRTHIYTYRMQDWYITTPDDVATVAPVPGKPDAEPTRAYITLVTCNPRWSSDERLITHGVLIKSEVK